MMWSRMGRLAIGTIGLGMLGAASWMRSPRPPQKRTTFIGLRRLDCVLPAQLSVERAPVEELLQAGQPRVGIEVVQPEPDGVESCEQLQRAVACRPRRLCFGQRRGQLGEVDPVAPRVGP